MKPTTAVPLVVLGVLGIAGQAVWMDALVGNYDEGLLLTGADRVLRGDMPYKDFWTLYGPAGFYLMAGLFRCFGESVLVERLFDILVKTGIVLLGFSTLMLWGRRAVAWAGALLILGLLIYLRSYSAPLYPAVAAILAAALALHRVAASGSRSAAIAAGLLVGVATLFRHDLGLSALVCAAAFLLRAGRWAAANGARRPRRSWLPGVVAPFATAFGVTVAPWLIALVLLVPGADLFRDFVRIPSVVYPAVRALPFPLPGDLLDEALRKRSPTPLGAAIVYLPLVVIGGCAAARLLGWQRGRREASLQLFDLLVAFGTLFCLKGLVRVSPFQMGAALVVSVLLIAAAAAMAGRPVWRRGLLAVGGLACLGLCAKPFLTAADRAGTGEGAPAASAVLSDRWITQVGTLCREPGWPRLRCFRLDPARQAIADHLRADGGAGQRLFFGVGRHDKIFVTDLALGFVVEAVQATRWHDLHPGVQTTREVQAEMIAEFSAGPPNRVIIDTEWDQMREPNASAESSGVHLLDDYLRGRYRPAYSAGPLTVLKPLAPDRP